MDIEQAYEAMINDIFWDGKAVGVCLSLPIITEINDVLSDMSEDERNAMKLHYGLTGEKPLSSLLVAGVLGTKSLTPKKFSSAPASILSRGSSMSATLMSNFL